MKSKPNVQSFHDPGTSTFTHLVDDGVDCAVIDPVLGFDQASGTIDTGPADIVAQEIARRGLRLQWLLETHVHADHLSASALLQRRLGGQMGIGRGVTEVQAIFRDVFNACDVIADGSAFDRLWEDREKFHVGRLQFQAIHLPGHTPADMAYVVAEQDGPSSVFVGDTLFMPDVGTARCDFPGGDAGTLYRSIQRLLAFEPDTKLYLCHDYPPNGRTPCCITTVGAQRKHNIHVGEGISEAEFVALRSTRDAQLGAPLLMQPSVQVNIRAGNFPPPEANGKTYLKVAVRGDTLFTA